MGWEYQREESQSFSTRIPEGFHRVRVAAAEMTQSKSGNDMIKLTLDVSGYPDTIYHYIVFMPDNVSMTNRMLTQFYDSFKDIPEGNKKLSDWIGKVGAAKIKHDEYNGSTNAKISWFLHADKQGDLPAWSEPKHDGGNSTPPADKDGFMQIPEGVDVPF